MRSEPARAREARVFRPAAFLSVSVSVSAALVLTLTVRPVSAEAELVDRIVAIIDQDVITLSEAEEAQRIARVRSGESPTLREIVDRLIELRLIAREVERFSPEPVPRHTVDAALLDLKESFSSPEAFTEALESNGLSESELEEDLRGQLKVTRYLDRRFRALTYVSDAEVERYFAEELVPELPAGLPVPSRQDYDEEIRRIIAERKFNERVELWIEELAARSVVQRYVW